MLMDALVRSLNIPTVNIGMKFGLRKVIAKQKEMGWDKADIPVYPSMLLGSYSISPYDVTKSYQVLANNGLKVPLTTIESITGFDGKPLYQRNIGEVSKQVLPEEATTQTLYAMQQVVERGTARYAWQVKRGQPTTHVIRGSSGLMAKTWRPCGLGKITMLIPI